MTIHYIDRILAARVYDVAIETPLAPAPQLSKRLSNRVYLKREDQQPVFSFKLRGAYNKIVQLGETERRQGVIAASAGNHAQGVGLAARKLGIKAVIVMPRTTPGIKVEAVKAFGVRTVLHGDSYDDAFGHAQELVESQGLTFIPPYDDPDVIAGQGSIGMEIARQHPDPLHAVFVPVGGGGLIAGIATYLKYLRPDIRIVGVEPEDAPTLYRALQSRRRVKLEQVGLFVDGVAVRQIGKEPFRLARQYVDEVVLVTTDEICAAIKDVFDDTRTMLEPAGALAAAGLKKYVAREELVDAGLVAINSGANINFDRLRHVAERAELGEQREALFAATIPEEPGSFRRFCRVLGKRSITEFNYRYASASEAHIFVGVKIQDSESEKEELLATLRTQGYEVLDMSGNEMAKVHVRHMVGGNSPDVRDENLYRFEFPERPGALLQFLNAMGQSWNISLFHYRSHGAAYGRVLVGMQIPPGEKKQVRPFLNKLGYRYWEEAENPAYRLFFANGQSRSAS